MWDKGKRRAKQWPSPPHPLLVPSPASAPAKLGTAWEVSSCPLHLLCCCPVPLHICLLSQEPDLRVGKCCVNSSPALEWGMTASLGLGAGVAAAWAFCRGWQSVTCLPVPSKEVHVGLSALLSWEAAGEEQAMQLCISRFIAHFSGWGWQHLHKTLTWGCLLVQISLLHRKTSEKCMSIFKVRCNLLRNLEKMSISFQHVKNLTRRRQSQLSHWDLLEATAKGSFGHPNASGISW